MLLCGVLQLDVLEKLPLFEAIKGWLGKVRLLWGSVR